LILLFDPRGYAGKCATQSRVDKMHQPSRNCLGLLLAASAFLSFCTLASAHERHVAKRNTSAESLSPVGTTVTVGQKPAEIVGADRTRRGIVFVNGGNKHVIYVMPGKLVAVGRGIPILPQGQQEVVFPGLKVGSAWSAVSDGGEEVPLEILELF
jgi:hypothetical protein